MNVYQYACDLGESIQREKSRVGQWSIQILAKREFTVFITMIATVAATQTHNQRTHSSGIFALCVCVTAAAMLLSQ